MSSVPVAGNYSSAPLVGGAYPKYWSRMVPPAGTATNRRRNGRRSIAPLAFKHVE